MIPYPYATPANIAPLVTVAPMPSRNGFDTPEPVYVTDAPMRIDEKLPAADFDTKQRVRTAAMVAKSRYPGPVGELVCRELLDWAEFGYRLSPAGHIMQLVAHIMDEP